MKGHSDPMNCLHKSINDLRHFYGNYCGTIVRIFPVKVVSDSFLVIPLKAFYFEPIKLKSLVA